MQRIENDKGGPVQYNVNQFYEFIHWINVRPKFIYLSQALEIHIWPPGRRAFPKVLRSYGCSGAKSIVMNVKLNPEGKLFKISDKNFINRL